MAEGGVPFRRLKQEPGVRAALPYARHVTEDIVALDSGALMLSLRLDGVGFETADVRDINDWHVRLNQTWRNVADERLAVWHHLVRRNVRLEPSKGHVSDFAREAVSGLGRPVWPAPAVHQRTLPHPGPASGTGGRRPRRRPRAPCAGRPARRR